MNWIVQHHPALTSTNLHAHAEVLARWRQNESPHGMVIVADTQTAGRGQHGRSFASPRGGLYFSAVVESVPPHLRHHLALGAGVAAASALRNAPISRFTHQAPQSLATSRTSHSCNKTENSANPILNNLDVRLRWPNDLMLDAKKLGGILVESAAAGPKFAAIIGIGINVNTEIRELPAELRPRAISLREHSGHSHKIGEIQSLILAGLATTLDILAGGNMAPVVEAARGLDSLLGHHVELRDGEEGVEIISGLAAGIGPAGELLIEGAAGLTAHRGGSIVAVDARRIR